MPQKSRALGQPQAMKKRTIQRAAGGKKIATVHLQKRLEHDGLVTPPDVIKVPENTQQKSKH